jgi:beta-phosphoglucomutase-like phosphatase (HAD superfamily)
VIASPGLVIFDCDGVLVDSEPIAMQVLLETLAEAGLSLDQAIGYDRFLGRSLRDLRGILARDFGIVLDDAVLERMRGRLYAAFEAELRPAPPNSSPRSTCRSAPPPRASRSGSRSASASRAAAALRRPPLQRHDGRPRQARAGSLPP